MSRVLIVGAGGRASMSLAAALAIADIGCKVVSVDIETAIPISPGPWGFEDLPAVCLAEPPRAKGWYQQFAGKRGRPPRY